MNENNETEKLWKKNQKVRARVPSSNVLRVFAAILISLRC